MPHDSSLRQLYVARLREFYRQPARLFWVYVFPTVLAVFLGAAFSRPPGDVAVDVVSTERTRAIVDQLRAYEIHKSAENRRAVALVSVSDELARRRLASGDTPLVVVLDDVDRVTYRYDPTRPEAVIAKAIVDDDLQRLRGRRDVVATADQKVTTPGSRYIDFLIPGLIGANTMGGGLWGVGFLLVNFRIGKLLKRFAATPMPRRNFLLALLGARLTFLLPDLVMLLTVGVAFFGMPIKGSLALVILVDVVGALAFAGIGLLVASRAQTIETVSGLMNLVMLPMWLCSGVFFRADQFPWYLQPLVQALPLTHLVGALRRVMLQGAGPLDRDILGALAILSAWAVVTFVLALRRFRWT
ncbi:MAG TPA: ABC transporter permease [Isosphaeraceae bacterium]|jgi:ABC-type multidrug transport system permease subunit